ncbi:MAG: hypothetical protein JWQ74_741 [Marmoricola sp.]|nr:hypothetical protein [Marmoricola sp.]
MNKRTDDTRTTRALRDLDPAATAVLSEEERQRSEVMFARVLAAPGPDHVPPGLPRRRRRRSRLLVLLGMVGAAGATGAALLLGGGTAFASWTPKPEPLTAADTTAAATTCRAALGLPDQGAPVVIAERRGGWTYVAVGGPRAEGFCLMPDDVIGHQDAAGRRDKGFFGGSSTDPAEAPNVARGRIIETESMQGSVPGSGRWPFRSDDGWFSVVQGYVGPGVTAVTVHPPAGPAVEASLVHGRFAAWWPSDLPSSKNPETMGPWSYTVTLADGSTRRVTGR